MKVKKYQAGSIAEAMKLVGRDIGPEALILSTKKIQGASVKDEFFEITAIPGLNNNNDTDQINSNETNQPKIQIEPNTTSSNSQSSEPNMSYLQNLRSELMSIREMMFILSRSQNMMNGFRMTPEAINIYGKLIRCGIDETYAKRFLEQGGVFSNSNNFTSKEIRTRVLKEMLKVIDVTDPFNNKGQVAAAFVGPTGVGKTTTIAKLAANLFLKQKKRVAFVSIDNYRIAALDQLKTYAGILGIPCIPAFNQKELRNALYRLRDKDVLLIDTAGQSHYDIQRLQEMQGLFDNLPIKTHLLLSAGTTESETEIIAKNFKGLQYNSYIFTKTDETKQRGMIINQLIKQRNPISYVTTGQRVPEDIVAATKLDILRLLF